MTIRLTERRLFWTGFVMAMAGAALSVMLMFGLGMGVMIGITFRDLTLGAS